MKLVIKSLGSYRWLCLSGIIFSLASFGLVRLDREFQYRWLAFALYLTSLLAVVVFVGQRTIKTLSNQPKFKLTYQRSELLVFLGVIVIAAICRFFWLTEYPFVAVGDEVRDCGLDVVKILSGEITNLFGYGNYFGYGLTIPILAIPFYFVFGHSVLQYRSYAAILGILDVGIIYLFLRFYLNRPAAVVGSLVLSALPLHLYYSRTEAIMVYDSLLTSVLVLSCYLFSNSRLKSEKFVAVGLLSGLTLGFHAALRPVVLIFLVSYFLSQMLRLKSLKKLFPGIMICFFFMVIGFGPRLLFTNRENFLPTGRFYALDTYYRDNQNQPTFSDYFKRYRKSLLVWFNEPTTSHYRDHSKPILTPVLAFFFLTGLVRAILKRNRAGLFLVLVVILIPFSNSAITEALNNDHRLMPLIPVAAILIALGFTFWLDRIKHRFVQVLAALIFTAYLTSQTAIFFTNQPANTDWNKEHYLSMYLIKQLKNNPIESNGLKYCLRVSPYSYQIFNLAHHQEQLRFFLPQAKLDFFEDTTLDDSDLIITKSDCQNTTNRQNIIDCSLSNNHFRCPLNYLGRFNLYY